MATRLPDDDSGLRFTGASPANVVPQDSARSTVCALVVTENRHGLGGVREFYAAGDDLLEIQTATPNLRYEINAGTSEFVQLARSEMIADGFLNAEGEFPENELVVIITTFDPGAANEIGIMVFRDGMTSFSQFKTSTLGTFTPGANNAEPGVRVGADAANQGYQADHIELAFYNRVITKPEADALAAAYAAGDLNAGDVIRGFEDWSNGVPAAVTWHTGFCRNVPQDGDGVSGSIVIPGDAAAQGNVCALQRTDTTNPDSPVAARTVTVVGSPTIIRPLDEAYGDRLPFTRPDITEIGDTPYVEGVAPVFRAIALDQVAGGPVKYGVDANSRGSGASGTVAHRTAASHNFGAGDFLHFLDRICGFAGLQLRPDSGFKMPGYEGNVTLPTIGSPARLTTIDDVGGSWTRLASNSTGSDDNRQFQGYALLAVNDAFEIKVSPAPGSNMGGAIFDGVPLLPRYPGAPTVRVEGVVGNSTGALGTLQGGGIEYDLSVPAAVAATPATSTTGGVTFSDAGGTLAAQIEPGMLAVHPTTGELGAVASVIPGASLIVAWRDTLSQAFSTGGDILFFRPSYLPCPIEVSEAQQAGGSHVGFRVTYVSGSGPAVLAIGDLFWRKDNGILVGSIGKGGNGYGERQSNIIPGGQGALIRDWNPDGMIIEPSTQGVGDQADAESQVNAWVAEHRSGEWAGELLLSGGYEHGYDRFPSIQAALLGPNIVEDVPRVCALERAADTPTQRMNLLTRDAAHFNDDGAKRYSAERWALVALAAQPAQTDARLDGRFALRVKRGTDQPVQPQDRFRFRPPIPTSNQTL